MSLSKGWISALALALCLGAATLISGCSFAPIYGENSPVAQTNLAFAYAEPKSNLQRIIYTELALSYPRDPNAIELQVALESDTRRVGRTASGSPATTYEAEMSGTVFVKDPTSGQIIYSVSRVASASYTTNGQRIADQQALTDAQERAAKALADQFRLLLATELPGKL